MTNRFVYNGAGDLTDLYDGKQIGSTNRTLWRYDNHGRVTAKVHANNQTNLIYAYDPLSRLTNRWSQAKGNTKYAYDRRGSLTNVDYATSSDLRYQFDALGRLTNMVDAAGTTRYTYTHGLLSTEDGPWANDTVAWEYNHARMRSALRLQQTATHWWTNSYAWDASHRLASVTSPAGTFTYGYTGAGNLRSGYSAPGGNVTNLYDSMGRMTLTAWKNTSGTVLNAHGYEIDAAHQRIRQTRTNSTASHSHTLGYQYDAAGQVTHARATNNSTGLPVTGELLGLTYDTAWNMTARTNGATVNYGLNNLNQVTGDGGTYTYTYDSNGNRTYRTGSGGGYVLMVYDDENQLIRQETDTSTTFESYRFKLEYLYDGKLRLRERKYYTWQFGSWYLSTTERYVYDGMLLVQERNSNTPAVTYTRGVDLSDSLGGAGGIGGLMARSHGFNTGTGAWSTHSAYHADGNGNVTALYSTSTGSQVGWYRYDAFGRLLQSSGSLASANRMRFSSKPWMAPGVDESAGMYYYGYRFYDPLTQRWVNRDPIEEEGGINLYTLALNAPHSYIDPFGEAPIEIPLDRFDPGGNRDRSREFNRGCIGLCSWYQSEGCGKPQVFPEDASNTKCFSSKTQADSQKCPQGKTRFVFAKQGKWKDGKSPKPKQNGRVPNDSIGSEGGLYNYIACVGESYLWMNRAFSPHLPMPTVFMDTNPPGAGGSYPNEIWCVTCKCEGK